MTQKKALQALHDENERLGLYKDAYAPTDHIPDVGKMAAQPDQEQEPVDYKKLAALGWQAVECQICGFSAQAFPKPEQEPVAWRFTGIAGLNRYMTQKKYDAQTPEIKKWYEPFKCANCITLPQRTWVGLTRMELIKCGVLPFGMSYELCQAIEAKLKDKNCVG